VPFLHLIRDPILAGQFPSWATYRSAALVVLVVASFAVLICARLQRRIIFQL
jgi:hypothetical protein